jgi:hypothetical protein
VVRLGHHRKRLRDLGAALGAGRELAERERWPPAWLERYQRERLDAVLRHARGRSAFWAALFAHVEGIDRDELYLQALRREYLNAGATQGSTNRQATAGGCAATAQVEGLRRRSRSVSGAARGDDAPRRGGPGCGGRSISGNAMLASMTAAMTRSALV